VNGRRRARTGDAVEPADVDAPQPNAAFSGGGRRADHPHLALAGADDARLERVRALIEKA
jgi:hypothetical protein